jgi:uncharacterized protein YbjT (DUF2867 family)
MVKPILVVGATGGVGRQVVSKLLANEKPVRVFARDFRSARSQFTDEVEYITGDVREPDTLIPAMDNIKAVVCSINANPQKDPTNTPKSVDYEGVHHLIEAAITAGVEHFLLVSWSDITPANGSDGAKPEAVKWKQKGEDVVRSSGLLYTIIRPGILTDDMGGEQALRMSQGDSPGFSGQICREDVAEVIVRALDEPAARNVTFEVIGERGTPPTDWARLFADLKKD